MFDPAELAVLRRACARQVTFAGGVENPALQAAFAEVRPEAFLGHGPWPLFRWTGGYRTTPDADPAWLYADVLVGIVPRPRRRWPRRSSGAAWRGSFACVALTASPTPTAG